MFDMGILLSNLLDNALEAGEKLKAGEGYIRLSLKRKESFLLLEVENRFDGRALSWGRGYPDRRWCSG